MGDHDHGRVAKSHLAENVARVTAVAELLAGHPEGSLLGQDLNVTRSLASGHVPIVWTKERDEPRSESTHDPKPAE